MYSADKMYEFYQDNIKNKYLKFLSGYYKLENLGSFIISIATALGFSFILYRLKDLTLDLIMIIGSSFLFVGVSISSIVKNYISYSEENYNYHIFDMFMEESKSKIEESEFLNFKNSIEFKNVDFIYPGTDKLVLKNLSFKIDKGDHIALLGINGSGKTTIIKLLLGFYRPTRGSILIDGIDMTNYSYDEISKMFAPMFQNVEPLALTIAEVVSAKEKSEQNINKIYEALKQVGLYDIVLSLEKNIDTPLTKILDSDGYVFSGGGNQKLAMARVIYNSERPIVILDEPTAALDSISEEKFYMELDSIIKNRTAIFITHRLASINFLDKIMVLNNGKIEEMGTHAELMEKNGIYKEMYDEQAYHYKFEGEL